MPLFKRVEYDSARTPVGKVGNALFPAIFAHFALLNGERWKYSDDTLHVIVSFRPTEREALDAEALEKIAQRVCDSIKLGNPKRITAVHGDTQDPHMHLAINLLDGKLQAVRGEWEAVETQSVSSAGFTIQYLQAKELYAEYKSQIHRRCKVRHLPPPPRRSVLARGTEWKDWRE